ncbi:MAG TPA: hypothetical protein VFI46_15805 [Jiangellaceae bacterium]|nr:hypothetical protein [Jiangellaceae bacterium]
MPLATGWHSTAFIDPVGDGAVMPILHLNGYKIANPALLARIGDEEPGGSRLDLARRHAHLLTHAAAAAG